MGEIMYRFCLVCSVFFLLVSCSYTKKRVYKPKIKLDTLCKQINPAENKKIETKYSKWRIKSRLIEVKPYKKTKYALFKVWKERTKKVVQKNYITYEEKCIKTYANTGFYHSENSRKLSPKFVSSNLLDEQVMRDSMEKTQVRVNILDANLDGVVTLDEYGRFAIDLLKPSISIQKISPLEISIDLHGYEVSRVTIPKKTVRQVRTIALNPDWKFFRPLTWGPRSWHWDEDQKKVLDTFDRIKPYIKIDKNLTFHPKDSVNYKSVRIKPKPPTLFRSVGRGARIVSVIGIAMEVLIQLAEHEEAKRLQKEWETLGFLDTKRLNY